MPDITGIFLRWTWMRAVLHRGYWLVTSIYLVLDADLSPFQLVFLGTAQGIVSLVFEIPTGVVADTISRKWSLVISHTLMGGSMVATGLVTSFPALILTQMAWGIAWTFASGADVAWITDELDSPSSIGRVLTAQARWAQIGAASGMIVLGILAWLTDRSTAMIVAGVATILLGPYVAIRFTEQRFSPAKSQHWKRSALIFRRGIALARGDREILLVFAATILVNGVDEVFGRLHPKKLIDLGIPEHVDEIIWFTLLGIATYAVGALALRIIEAHIDGLIAARRVYALACFIGTFGLAMLAYAPGGVVGSAGILIVGGIAMTVTRAVGVIWINRRATSEVRATMQSFLGQAEYLGEILFGVTFGVLAQVTTLTSAFTAAFVLFACTGLMVRFVNTATLEKAHSSDV
jgi:MFS transporter, DHA3 family, tetracycline resistance protein